MGEGNIQNNSGATGSNARAGMWEIVAKPVRLAYHRHHYRYNAWDQGSYRFWFNLSQTLLILLLVGGTVWLGRTVWRRHQERLAADLAVQSLARGDYTVASQNGSRAYALNPADVRVCRVMAEVMKATRSPAELVWWQRTETLEPTTENKLTLAGAALHCQASPYPLATQILAELAAIGTTNASYQETAALLALNAPAPAEAAARLEAACNLDPANQEYALNLAVFQLSSLTNGDKKPIRVRMEKLALDEHLRPAALRALVADLVGQGDDAAALNYSAQLLAVPQPQLEDQLQNLGILRQLKSSTFVASLLAMEKSAESSSSSIVTASDWMRAHGLVSENIDWLTQSPERIQSRPTVKAALARSYLQNGNWQALLDFSSHGEWDDLDYLRLAAISHAWAQLGMATLAESNWGEAARKASDRLGDLTNLLALAEAWQLKPEADDLRQRERQFTH